MAKNKTHKKAPVSKNEVLKAEIVDLTHEGAGVAKIDYYPVFIEGALIGETVEFKIVKTKKTFAFGKLIKVIEKSPDRVEVVDKVYAQTGTMPLQHLSYPAQLAFKKKQVETVLQKIGKLEGIKVNEVIGMDSPLGYRNKAQVPVRKIDGRLTTGFFRKNSHDVLPIEDFQIQDPEIDQAIVRIRDIMRQFHVKPYNEKAHTGWLRHIIVRRGHSSKELMVVLVTTNHDFHREEEIVTAIKKALPELVSLIQNINPEKTNVILGSESRILWGEDNYKDQLMGFTFSIGHQSFYQVNSVQTEQLYRTAVDYAGLTGQETVIDAYCGIGTLTLALAQKAEKVYGLEIIEPAIENARLNALNNSVSNVEFKVGPAEEIITEWAEAQLQADVIVVDPPRKGLAPEFIESVLTMKPEKMVYVSCNPATLARDLKLLTEGGYTVEAVQPVDMFPQTYHVECVVLMSMMK
ncbi:RNA methyltransferase, TrmA family [Alkalibacterium sp. AK22]|uniref:23S rRNA (uracil(1939)-C(5))-methyltransferase RlmD n=1 Tax=Alkalibacterium sp. AK22 TaxID=1229520 RepID=UPI000445B359|nr:23S rRNA (uracil(1939)-C(5))-methyltransferase RlmD [Alkalibacterium sp. AK22]EXJ22986.1 RNA methyltransferase, TrmA family [Alkalibacterium sp. AK22]